MTMIPACAAALLCAAGCVDLPPSELPRSAVSSAVESPFKGLDPGYKTQETAHFLVSAYGSDSASRYASLCEANYTRIMQDLGLYSFAPARPYNVVIYKDSAEYHSKTGQPDWSGGAAYGNALLLYEGQGLEATAAHEMTHLVFNEFMGLSVNEQLRWINEGAAVYEETRSNQNSAAWYAARVTQAVAPNPIPFSQMINLAPQTESRRNVDRWYAQAGSVVGFMIRKGGSFSFYQFLDRLRGGASADEAVSAVYGNAWKSLSDVEKAWQLEVGS